MPLILLATPSTLAATAVFPWRLVHAQLLCRLIGCLWLVLQWGSLTLRAQIPTATRNVHDYEALPPSPTVAALGSYGTIPVSYHTGVPDISVPLYTLSLQGLSLPIALTYHSNGLLVDERASNVGLGWSCTALSVISHTIHGRH